MLTKYCFCLAFNYVKNCFDDFVFFSPFFVQKQENSKHVLGASVLPRPEAPKKGRFRPGQSIYLGLFDLWFFHSGFSRFFLFVDV